MSETYTAHDFGAVRIEVVPDDNAQADPLIPKDILDSLGPNDVFTALTGHMMYMRQSLWDRIKHKFPQRNP